MENTKPTAVISVMAAMMKYGLSRPTIDRWSRAGVITKLTIPCSRKVFLDENQLISALAPKNSVEENSKQLTHG